MSPGRRACGLVLLGLVLGGCLPAMTPQGFGAATAPQGSGDDSAGRCQQGLDMLEQARCAPGRPGTQRVELLQIELSDFKQKCKDATSQQRVAAIESSCVPLYYEREREAQAERRKVRARYVGEVSALLLDPEYAPLADREGELREQAERRPNDRQLASELAQVREKLSALAQKHGVEPAQHRALELW